MVFHALALKAFYDFVDVKLKEEFIQMHDHERDRPIAQKMIQILDLKWFWKKNFKDGAGFRSKDEYGSCQKTECFA
jgi:hypothetical protein